MSMQRDLIGVISSTVTVRVTLNTVEHRVRLWTVGGEDVMHLGTMLLRTENGVNRLGPVLRKYWGLFFL